jgi:hypothetical protein
MMIVPVIEGDVNVDHLSICQGHGLEGLYAATMAGYLQWLAPLIGDIRSSSPNVLSKLRPDAVSSSAHRRTADIGARLAYGFRMFLKFGSTIGAISPDEHTARWVSGRAALMEAVEAQGAFQAAEQSVGAR